MTCLVLDDVFCCVSHEEGEERLLLGLRNHTNLEGDIVETQHFCKYLWKKVGHFNIDQLHSLHHSASLPWR